MKIHLRSKLNTIDTSQRMRKEEKISVVFSQTDSIMVRD